MLSMMPDFGGDSLDNNKRLRVALEALAEISKAAASTTRQCCILIERPMSTGEASCKYGIPGFAAGQQQAKHSRRKDYSKFDDRHGPG